MQTTFNQRWRSRRDSYRPAGETIRPREYEVAAIPEAEAKAFVLEHHYSRSFPAARRRLGLFWKGRLAGVAVFSHPVRDEVLTRVFPTGCALDSVELGRFVLLDEVPGNGETWFLARCFERLRRDRLVGVVSFSDPVPRRDAGGWVVFPGHIGTIYQAASAVALGRTAPRTLRLLPDGAVLSDRALQKVRAGERGAAYVRETLLRSGARAPAAGESDADWLREVLPGLTRPLRHAGCFRYAWPLDRRGRRLLEGRGQAYPKRQPVLVDIGRPPADGAAARQASFGPAADPAGCNMGWDAMAPKTAEKPIAIEDVDFDDPEQVARYYEEVDRRGQQHVNDAIDDLKARGEIDKNGERTKKELPPDMREDSDCDL